MRSTTFKMQTVLQQSSLDFGAIIEQRERDVEVIENELREVNGLMQDMSSLAKEQSAVISVVDDNMTKSAEFVDRGLKAIKRAEEKQAKQTCIIL